MPTLARPTAGNHLIDGLPRTERLRLLGSCETTELSLSDALYEPGEPMRHVYFPTEAFVSLVVLLEGHPGLEVGMVGREGMLGAEVALGMRAARVRSVVQGAGQALRIASSAFNREVARSVSLRRTVERYLLVLMAQGAASTACVRFHLLGQRLARWLLMSQDRAGTDSFQVTHEFLAYMLGVRRVGVTVAAGELQRRGLIAYRRGQLTVLDRASLQKQACSCYASDCKRFDRQALPRGE